MRWFGRIQNVIPATARCYVCDQTGQTRCRDLDFHGRFVCDACAPHDQLAETFLRRQCRLDCPSDELIEEHL